jgi:hypothetical protein
VPSAVVPQSFRLATIELSFFSIGGSFPEVLDGDWNAWTVGGPEPQVACLMPATSFRRIVGSNTVHTSDVETLTCGLSEPVNCGQFGLTH